MSETNLYYVYIDSKIRGTIDQLLSYFQADVFNPHDCICIYFKYYKDIAKYIDMKLKNTHINYKFIRKNSDLSFQKNKVVFYLFNAQSNCKITALRYLTHIFVTHGESHKLASIKPIIRIYDFVISSGQMGIERFLKAGIFNLYNIEHESRILPMGDTFIGQNNYIYSENSHNLLYAPTWEGGVANENYSSIGQHSTAILKAIIESYSIHSLYIQPHPNTGHRDKNYKLYLKHLIKSLKKLAIPINIIILNATWRDYWFYRGCKIISQPFCNQIEISHAVVDISAMEMQLINKQIPTLVLFEQQMLKTLVIPNKISYLYAEAHVLSHLNMDEFNFSVHKEEVLKHQDYMFSYYDDGLKKMSFRQRIQRLCQFSTEKKRKHDQENLELY